VSKRLAEVARAAFASLRLPGRDSRDDRPWEHPYLTETNLRRFRDYSQQVWDHACARPLRGLHCAFLVNMAQSMYIWARMARRNGVDAELFLHPLDTSAISRPEWEDFDGEHADVLDGPGFLAANPALRPEVPCHVVAMDGDPVHQAYKTYRAGDRRPLLRLLAGAPAVRAEALLHHEGFHPYFPWARELSRFDVACAASSPFAAYAAGRPYCALTVGGDLQIDCGRGDAYGAAMSLAFNAARFLIVTNPHALGHCRRLGFRNAVYLPYLVDTTRYHPGPGRARSAWEARYGAGVYVLTTARLDSGVKGHDEGFFRAVVELVRRHPRTRFVFLAWGRSVEEARRAIQASALSDRILLLSPVGKQRLLDYYRSCDLVLDQIVYGYHGATALEAAAVGRPVVMRWRAEHYAPLYRGDLAPVVNVDGPEALVRALPPLLEDEAQRRRIGAEMREWLVRQHGEQRALPLLLALLSLAADPSPLPPELRSPLDDPESAREVEYHRSRLVDRA
jgi:glycosyltransferase involved in cell wall biosynthesis